MFDDLRRNFLMNPSSGLKVKCKTSGGTCLEALVKVVVLEILGSTKKIFFYEANCGQGSGFVRNLRLLVFKSSRKEFFLSTQLIERCSSSTSK